MNGMTEFKYMSKVSIVKEDTETPILTAFQ